MLSRTSRAVYSHLISNIYQRTDKLSLIPIIDLGLISGIRIKLQKLLQTNSSLTVKPPAYSGKNKKKNIIHLFLNKLHVYIGAYTHMLHSYRRISLTHLLLAVIFCPFKNIGKARNQPLLYRKCE